MGWQVANKWARRYSNSVTVNVSSGMSDTKRGAVLVAAYANAAALTPGGVALSNGNRAVVMIPPGRYLMASGLALASNYVDLVATAQSRMFDRPTQSAGASCGGGSDTTHITIEGVDATTIFPAGVWVCHSTEATWHKVTTSAYADETTTVTVSPAAASTFAGTAAYAYNKPMFGQTMLIRGSGGATLLQTAADVRLSGLTVVCTGSTSVAGATASDALRINVSATGSNAASIYSDSVFFCTVPTNAAVAGPEHSAPVWGETDIAGTWYNCRTNNSAWRPKANMVLSASMYDCHGANLCFGSDQSGASISGHLERCIGTAQAFGGCTVYGCDISGTLIDCEGGDNSFAMGKAIKAGAVLKRCSSGAMSFGSYAGSGTDYGSVEATAILEDCVSTGNGGGNGGCFGQGHASCALAGSLVRCRIGTVANYAAGTCGGTATTFTGSVSNCHPWRPTLCTGATTIRVFDNGQTYIATKTNGSVTFTLPASIAGLTYTVVRGNASAGNDVIIDPSGSETIQIADGTVGGAGKYITNASEETGSVTLTCHTAGAWIVTHTQGTWSQES